MTDDDIDAAWAHQQELEHLEQEHKSLDMSEYAGSEGKYLKAADIEGKVIKVKISGVSLLEFNNDGEKEKKPALSIHGKEKQVVCNASSVKALIAAFGKDSDKWVGKDIQLSTQHYASLGKSGIVITPLVTGDPNDDIPFAFAFLAPLAAMVIGAIQLGGPLVA